MTDRLDCIAPMYHQLRLHEAMLARARGIRYGTQRAQSPREREWAKSLTFVETYGVSARRMILNGLIQRQSVMSIDLSDLERRLLVRGRLDR